MLIDRSKLRGEMFVRNISVANLSKIMKCTRASIYYKLNGVREFTEKEIAVLVDIFGTSIFFNQGCSQIDNK